MKIDINEPIPNYHFPFVYGLFRGSRYNGGTTKRF